MVVGSLDHDHQPALSGRSQRSGAVPDGRQGGPPAAALLELAGEASSGPEAIELVEVLQPELVLMDINMPEMNGIEATRRIVSAHPDVVVFLCSTYDVEDLPPGAADSGASAYVNKERFGAETLRQLWAAPGFRAFATA